MKKLILLVGIILLITSKCFAGVISVSSFVTPEDVSIAHLELFRTTVVDAINVKDGSLIQAGTVPASALDANSNPVNRWNEAFNDFVYTGLLPPTTSGTLTSTTTLGTAYIDGVRVVKDATANTYTATNWTWVDLSSNGTYTYQENTIGSNDPSITANSIRLCRVSTDGTQVTAVRDDRITSVQLETNEDFYRTGLSLTTTSPDTISVSPGVCYHGTTRVSKTASTSLALGTAADWDTGVSNRATSTKGYVVVDVSGNIKLSITAPTKTDTSGNSAGDLRYSVVSTVYRRVLGSFYMNAVGSGNVPNETDYNTPYSKATNTGDTKLKGSIVQVVAFQTGALATVSTTMPIDDTIPQITEGGEVMTLVVTPTLATNKLKIEVVVIATPGATDIYGVALFQDATAGALRAATGNSAAASRRAPVVFTHYMDAGTTSAITFRVRIGRHTEGNIFFNGDESGNQIFGGVAASSMTIMEIKQ